MDEPKSDKFALLHRRAANYLDARERKIGARTFTPAFPSSMWAKSSTWLESAALRDSTNPFGAAMRLRRGRLTMQSHFTT